MITGLRAQNFKSWKDTGDLRIAPLTGLFGTNSSGKTSILQALLLLKQSAEFPEPGRVLFLGDDRASVNLGTFPDVVHGHDSDLSIRLTLSWKREGDGGRLEAAVGEVGGHLKLMEFEIREDSGTTAIRQGDGKFELVLNGRIAGEVFSPWGIGGGLYGQLYASHYLGPLRQRPQRAAVVWSGTTPVGLGSEGGEFAQALLSDESGEKTTKLVAEALRCIGLASGFKIDRVAPNRRDYEIRLQKTDSSAEVLLTDVGFGISQVLPVLVLCFHAGSGSTLIIEQPELHLHPAAQAELADVLIDVVKNRNMQIILESHSEHLLRRIQRRIADESFGVENAALYFCEMDNGASKCTPLDVTSEGFIKNWPKDFFGDEMGELAAITDEAMKRRLAKTR